MVNRRWRQDSEKQIDRGIVFWCQLVLGMVFAVFMARGLFLTTVMGGYYEKLATDNRIRREKIEPKRGLILDRNDKPLAINVMEGNKSIRFYPSGEIVAPIVGYMSKLMAEDLTNCRECGKDMWVGRSGLEKQYQDELVGVTGERVVEETAQGEYLREVSRKEPIGGRDIKTNIDLEWQKASYWALKRGMEKSGAKSGSVVISNGLGQILALVSLPTFDPNLFIGDGKRGEEGGDYADVSKMMSDEEKLPMFNRVVSGAFAPGSVFKPMVVVAGLMEKKIERDTLIEDTGEIVVGQSRFGNWLFDKSGGTEGKIDVVRALARSNDIFFYRLGERLGVDLINKWGKLLGFGQKTGIDLPGEVAGLLPSPLWREREIGERWYLGNTYHLAIGQGDLLATPLQMNVSGLEVVSGQKCEPRLVGVGKCRDLEIRQEVRDVVIEGMRQTCMAGGTGVPFFNLKGVVWCKTGTAQQGGEKSKPHAWINVVIPKGDNHNDWLVVTVMMQEAGEGSAEAGPVAREIVDLLMK